MPHPILSLHRVLLSLWVPRGKNGPTKNRSSSRSARTTRRTTHSSGKGANIARLFDAGLPVPGGFCVTTAAYRELLDDDLRRAIAELDDLDVTDAEALAEAGEVLAEQGAIERPDDVWFLRKDELFAALDGETIDVDVAARRAQFERQSEIDAPALVTSEGEIPRGKAVEGIPEGTLLGTGVSAGTVEATARVVRNPAESTRKIETGDRIRIDGTQGTVEILEDVEGETERTETREETI